ncbi:MAG: solute-binding protein [Hydrococcus sp. RU_2_2]|jgi:phosphate transport system substrate-binding protein|nr:solute-binding protein [Hydrococcus sp. RU_2_2]NJP21559.1 solute-binding protein [Hydrococcus sp. CRU_1_1]NJQ96701.1 solute-binding protein [Hydrococcus sp. CSU_1_8]
MSQKKRLMISLPWIGGIAAIAIALFWSLGLVGRGVWKLTRSAPNRTVQTKQTSLRSFELVRDVPSGLFSYGGSPTWAPIRLAIDSSIQAKRPEFRLRYVQPIHEPPSTRAAIKMLLDDRLAFVQSSEPLHPEDRELATQNGFQLEQIPVAIDSIVVVVHPDLYISGLTLEQLRSIYTGQITNWREVGGPDLEIIPYSRPASAGDKAEFFVREVLEGQPFGYRVEFSPTSTEALRKLENEPGGIYYDSAALVLSQCQVKPLALGRFPDESIAPYRDSLVAPAECPNRRNQPNLEAFQTGKYPLTLDMYVVIKQNGRSEERAGKAYANFLLTEQGQELIERAGFVRIR